MVGVIHLLFQRIALVVEFDGRPFCGWQRQENGLAVQQVLETALQAIDGAGEHRIVAAGRTDSGVHGLAMVAHTDVPALRWQRSPRAYLHGLNQHLPVTVRVVAVRAVAADFHARFDCQQRRYRYLIWNRSTAPALMQWRHWWMPRPLDLVSMQRAAAYCIGVHDFSALRATGCQAEHARRCIDDIIVTHHGNEVMIEVAANAFLYHMVRNLVGTLVVVGMGRQPPEWMAQLLRDGDRSQAGQTAPAHGLYFIDAVYPDFSAMTLSKPQS
ncbi:MAG: tRNA pseudouridine(38-40) synthase TruA [Mariprofundales bacterium]|nr:tRNA pseudouridine(38-40) synthase TruA [Mariprofundales bacterium]